METIQVTVKEFQDLRGLKNAAEAGNVLNFLAAQGLASQVGKRQHKKPNGKNQGKPAVVWQIPQTVTITLFDASDIPTFTVQSENDTVEVDAEETQTLEV